MDTIYAFIPDYASVLERLGGNRAFLDKLLLKFRDSYSNISETLDGFIDEGKLEEAHRLVHSIKGVSGNLGMDALYKKAMTLENRMREGHYERDSDEKAEFLTEIKSVFTLIG